MKLVGFREITQPFPALSDIYGSDTPELLFWESEDGSYGSPQILTVLTYEKGALKTLWHGKPGESFFSFALYRRENEKVLWFIDYMPVVDSGYTIISSFEENHGMLSLCERAYYSAMYNMSMTFDETYPTDWFTIQVQGYNSDKASLQMVSGGYVLTADNLENVTLKANNREAHAQAAFPQTTIPFSSTKSTRTRSA